MHVNQEHGMITEQELKGGIYRHSLLCWPPQVHYGHGESLKVKKDSLKLQYREGL